MQLGVRNTGDKTVPALTVNDLDRRQGGRRPRPCPSAIRDPQPDLAQPDRPVWVLAAGYPKLAGSSEPGGAETSNRKTFDFGPLKPGATAEAVWKLSAVKAGSYTLLYGIDAGLSGEAKAETDGGVAARRLLRGRDQPPHRRTPKSPTAAKSSKSASTAQEPASSVAGVKRARCAPASSPRAWRWSRCPPAARPATTTGPAEPPRRQRRRRRR